MAFVQKLLTSVREEDENSIEIFNNGWFSLHGKKHYIGKVYKGNRKASLWKGEVEIKLEDKYQGVKSFRQWFN